MSVERQLDALAETMREDMKSLHSSILSMNDSLKKHNDAQLLTRNDLDHVTKDVYCLKKAVDGREGLKFSVQHIYDTQATIQSEMQAQHETTRFWLKIFVPTAVSIVAMLMMLGFDAYTSKIAQEVHALPVAHKTYTDPQESQE